MTKRKSGSAGRPRTPVGPRFWAKVEHLEPVTNRENTIRGVAGDHRRAEAALITHCANGHLFDEANTYVWPKTGWRQCRACTRKRNTDARKAKAAKAEPADVPLDSLKNMIRDHRVAMRREV